MGAPLGRRASCIAPDLLNTGMGYVTRRRMTRVRNRGELAGGAGDLTHENWPIADESAGGQNGGHKTMPKGKKHTPEQIIAILRFSTF